MDKIVSIIEDRAATLYKKISDTICIYSETKANIGLSLDEKALVALVEKFGNSPQKLSDLMSPNVISLDHHKLMQHFMDAARHHKVFVKSEESLYDALCLTYINKVSGQVSAEHKEILQKGLMEPNVWFVELVLLAVSETFTGHKIFLVKGYEKNFQNMIYQLFYHSKIPLDSSTILAQLFYLIEKLSGFQHYEPKSFAFPAV